MLNEEIEFIIQERESYIMNGKLINEKELRDRETRLLNRYFLIKTDNLFQKHQIAKLIESVIHLYKNLLKEQKMIDDYKFQRLQRDMESLKMELRETLLNNKLTLCYVLTLIIGFSRNRLEVACNHSLLNNKRGRTLIKTIPYINHNNNSNNNKKQKKQSPSPIQNSKMHISQYYSQCDTFINNNYYGEMHNQLQLLPLHEDRKYFLHRIYKELMSKNRHFLDNITSLTHISTLYDRKGNSIGISNRIKTEQTYRTRRIVFYSPPIK